MSDETTTTVNCRYGKMTVFSHDAIVSKSLLQYGEWAQQELEFLRVLLDPGDYVIDVGAYLGTHALAFSSFVGKNGLAIAVEPQPRSFSLLKTNIEQNGLGNVRLLNCAVSDKAGTIFLTQLDPSLPGNYAGATLCENPDQSGDMCEVQVITIDSLDMARCKLIKLDVETMEYKALLGSGGTIETCRPYVFSECHSIAAGWPVIDLLYAQHYRLYLLNVRAFNSQNYFGNQANFLEDGRETSILAVPVELVDVFHTRLPVFPEFLIPIANLDDLAMSLLKKPQYKYEVAALSSAGQILGNDYWANETELAILRKQQIEANELRESEERNSSLLKEANRDRSHLAESLATTGEALKRISSQLDIKNEELEMLNAQKLELQRESLTLKEHLAQSDARSASTLRQLEHSRNELQSAISSSSRQIKELQSLHSESQAELAKNQRRLLGIQQSHGWKALSAYHRLSRAIFRPIRLLKEMRLLRKTRLFDASWYEERYPDVRAAKMDARRHYLLFGAYEGRDPSALFDSRWYLSAYEDVAEAHVNPLVHYILHGEKEGRHPIGALSPRDNSHIAFGGQREMKNVGASGPSGESGMDPGLSISFLSSLWTALTPTECSDFDYTVDHEKTRSEIDNQVRARISELALPHWNTVGVEDTALRREARNLQLLAAPHPEVSIIIPVYNHARYTIECLISIAKYTASANHEVILMDDSSSDETQGLAHEISNLVYVRNEENRGFIRSCNRAAAMARGRYLVFLNNDAQVTDGWLTRLTEAMQDDSVGAAGPKVIFPNGRLQEAGAIVNSTGETTMVGIFDDPSLAAYNRSREVPYCSGVCLIVRKDLFDECGGFSENYLPAYYEDCDLAFRIRAKGKRVIYVPDSIIIHHLSASSPSINKQQVIVRNRTTFLENWQKEIDDLNEVKLIAFYLPQFHPIPENDRWWGKGFTEWAKVVRAKPNFVGHCQPHFPTDLGFYDLRIDAVRREQGILAKRYGIDAFNYYYYWFHGKRLLQEPLDRMLESGEPDLPFCLTWANENWTRRWDGLESEVLIGQQHSDDDDRAVIRDVARYMRHRRYLKVNGKPMFNIYRVGLFPNISRTVDIWRDTCSREGIGEIYLCMVESFEHARTPVDPRSLGFDASIEFPPHEMGFKASIPDAILNPNFAGAIYDYKKMVLNYMNLPVPEYKKFRSVMPGWDNTARRQDNPVIFVNGSPGVYQAWLEAVLEQTREYHFGDEKLVFVNAWNEWAEGNHLEPDSRYGHAYLEATYRAKQAHLYNFRARW